MPTYDYKCDECGIVFERFQHFSDDPIEVCPECSGPVHRIIHPVGVIFKGKGFYVTDNNRSKSSLATPGTTKDEATTKTEESTSSDKETAAAQPESKSADSGSTTTTTKAAKESSD